MNSYFSRLFTAIRVYLANFQDILVLKIDFSVDKTTIKYDGAKKLLNFRLSFFLPS